MTDRISPFAYTLSSGSRTTLNRLRSGAERTIRNLLRLLGEPGRSTVSLWPMPEGVHLFDIKGTSRSFVQTAGTAEAMTIEWGRYDADGNWHVSTLGHGGDRPAAPDVAISYYDGKHEKWIYPDETFDAAEAADVFIHYLDTETVPEKYVLREYDLSEADPA